MYLTLKGLPGRVKDTWSPQTRSTKPEDPYPSSRDLVLNPETPKTLKPKRYTEPLIWSSSADLLPGFSESPK